MKRERDSSNFWKPIYYVAKLLGLSPFKLREKEFHPPSFLDKLYPLSFGIMYIALSILETNIWKAEKIVLCSTKILTHMILLYHLISFAAPFCTLATFVFMNKEIVCLMNELCTLGYELKNIGIEKDGGDFAKNVFATSLTANVFCVTMCVALSSMEPSWSIVISIGHNVQELIFLNTILIFVNILVYIKQRFALLNEKLNDYKAVRNIGASHRHRVSVTARATDAGDSDGLKRIRKIKALHLKLSNLMNSTARIFVVPILLFTCQFFSTLVVSCYWIYFTVINPTQLCSASLGVTFSYNFCTLLRMAIAIVEMLVIAYASRVTCIEGNTTQNVLQKLWNDVRTTGSEFEFLMFSVQLLQNPLIVSAFGFFDLDYSYLYKANVAHSYLILPQTLGAVLAYVIISIQLDAS